MESRSSEPIPRIAVVGSGPAGCYATQRIVKELPEAEVTVLDRLPVPYGLVRYGVAPDHQGTKAVTRQFDRLFTDGSVVFLGNVRLGEDLELSELQELFDVVVLAIGRAVDAVLDLPDSALDGVYGAGRLTRLVNGHPDEAGLRPELGTAAVVIGHGNVAIDVVRMLIKTTRDWDGSDIDDEVHAGLVRSLRRIELVGRSRVGEAKFDPVLVRELGRIDGVRFRVHGMPGDPTLRDDPRYAAVEALGRIAPVSPRITVDIRFGLAPRSLVDAAGRVDGVIFEDEHGRIERIAADSVITAIGFDRPDYLELLSGADPDRGELAPGLFAAGWFLRGARGTIPENRIGSHRIAAAIVEQLRSGRIPIGRPGRAALPAAVLGRAVGFADWRRIDEAELAARTPGRVRRKFRTVEELLAAIEEDVPRPERERAGR